MSNKYFENVTSMKAVRGGIDLGNNQYLLNSEGWDRMFKVFLGTGTAYLAVFFADASNESSAVDRVVDFCEDNAYTGLYSEYSTLEEELKEEAEQSGVEVDEYISEMGLTVAGNQSHYVDLQGIEEIK